MGADFIKIIGVALMVGAIITAATWVAEGDIDNANYERELYCERVAYGAHRDFKGICND